MTSTMTSTRSIRQIRALAILAIVAGIGAAPAPARAATFAVTNLNDAGGGSLRDAVGLANAADGADEIVFQAGLTGTITLTTGTITITGDTILTGPGPRVLTVDANHASRAFIGVSPNFTNISGLRIINGTTDRGGAIGFQSSGKLTMTDCEIRGHTSTFDGGAVFIFQGSASFTRCTFSGNHADGNGAAVWWGQGGGSPTMSFTNCTFSGNIAGNFGGALRQATSTLYTTTLTNCTITGNMALGGGGLSIGAGTMTFQNTIVAKNTATNTDFHDFLQFAGSVVSNGHNLIGVDTGVTIAPQTGDQIGTLASPIDPLVGPLADNGGFTDTVALLATSPAIDGGGGAGAPSTDQRDFPRVGCSPDIGAFEFQTPADDDGDGVLNCLDTCPNTPACGSVDQTGCPTESDGDGVFDGCDTCPGTLAGDPVDASGCSTADEDADAVKNDADLCRGTPACAVVLVDPNGCPPDADGDGIFDGCDNCAGSSDLADTDGDGIPNCLDACPAVGDTDGDGVQDCQDGCPADGLKIAAGACGCGNVDIDANADGTPDCLDACPAVGDPDAACTDGNSCTVDQCVAGVGCTYTQLTGIPGARCLCGVLPAACAGQSAPASVGKKSDQACDALASAESVDGRKRRRLLSNARVLLKQASKNVTRAGLTKECATALGAAFTEQRARALEAKQAAN